MVLVHQQQLSVVQEFLEVVDQGPDTVLNKFRIFLSLID